MIIDILLFIFSFILKIFALMLPNWSFPDIVVSSITYFMSSLTILQGIFPIDHFFLALIALLTFEILYVGMLVTIKIINYVRGAGGL